jgi:hypothetical protein
MDDKLDLGRTLGPSYLIAPLYLGSALDQTGQLFFFNTSSALATGFQAGNATAAITYTWPTAGPAGNNYVLASSTTGVLSWLNSPGTFAPIGSAFVTIGNDATLTAERALTGTSNQIVITDNGANSTVVLSTPQNIHSGATPTFASLSLTATSNQLVLGTTRTATLTAPTPASASRTYTFPDQTGDYSVVASIGTQTVSGTKTFDGQLIGKGTATNDSAAAGYIGEYIESIVAQTNVPAATTVWGDGTSISLTAGDWDVNIIIATIGNGATFTRYQFGLSSTSGNSTTGLTLGVTLLDASLPVSGVSTGSGTLSNMRVSLSGTTTYYFKVLSVYTVGTPQYAGIISARRVR